MEILSPAVPLYSLSVDSVVLIVLSPVLAGLFPRLEVLDPMLASPWRVLPFKVEYALLCPLGTVGMELPFEPLPPPNVSLLGVLVLELPFRPWTTLSLATLLVGWGGAPELAMILATLAPGCIPVVGISSDVNVGMIVDRVPSIVAMKAVVGSAPGSVVGKVIKGGLTVVASITGTGVLGGELPPMGNVQGKYTRGTVLLNHVIVFSFVES